MPDSKGSQPSVPTPRRWLGVWIVALFNLIMGGLFGWNVVASVAEFLKDHPEWERPPEAFDYAVVVLNALVPICLFAATIYLIVWHNTALTRAVTLQRMGAWAMVLVTASLALEFLRPSEGGVGGFLLLLAFPFYVLLTAAAWLCALYIRHVKWAQHYADKRNAQNAP